MTQSALSTTLNVVLTLAWAVASARIWRLTGLNRTVGPGRTAIVGSLALLVGVFLATSANRSAKLSLSTAAFGWLLVLSLEVLNRRARTRRRAVDIDAGPESIPLTGHHAVGGRRHRWRRP